MRRRNARGGISRTVSVYLDEDTNNRLIRAKDRSGRSKTIEVQIRLRDHLKRFPDFYNEEIFREVIEENEWHCCKVSDEAAFCLIQRPYISKTLLTRRISPRGSP